ncbi:MAG: MMPL family transporter [Chloroflexota bacterium]|nr:MMPL family transporter [Chloroflexota bacterium]
MADAAGSKRPGDSGRFAAWGRFVHRRRWAVVAVSLAVFAVVVPFAFGATAKLSPGGWVAPGSEAIRVDEALVGEFGRRSVNHYLLFRDPTGELAATDPAFRTAVETTLAPLRADPDVIGIVSYGPTGNPAIDQALLAADARSSIAVVALGVDVDRATATYPAFREQVDGGRLEVLVGGWPAASEGFTAVTEADLKRAETVSLPLTLMLLTLVFGSVVAAGLPVAVGVLAFVATLAGIGALSRFVETSVFAVNVASMIGLAVAIDYSLFLVSRYREEIAAGIDDPEEALAATMATAGRAVLFSGLTVAIGIAGLGFFPVMALRTIGVAGALVVLLGIGFSLTFLAALLAILGPRVDRFRIPLPRHTFLNRHESGFWHSLAAAVMRRPFWVLLPTLAVLLAAGVPFRDFRGGSPGMTMLPRDQEARQLYDAVQQDYPQASLSPVYVLVRPRNGSMTDAANLERLRAFSAALAVEPGVRRVDGIWTFAPPDATPEGVATTLVQTPELATLAQRYLTPHGAVLEVAMSGDDSDPSPQRLVGRLRASGMALSAGAFDVEVGGASAINMELVDTIERRAPLAVGFVILVTYLVLLLLLGSVLLPLKAILMNLLSLTASYGALVWVFQEGHLSGLLGFEPLGYTSATVPLLMFCFVFGLSMDYEVLMLTRIKEEYERCGDNTLAVARGLEATGRVVTSAALIMIVVFGSFGLSQILLIKSLGIGQMLAVAVDATLVRALLVPATMRLLGDWNWWAPSPLRRLAGVRHRVRRVGVASKPPAAPVSSAASVAVRTPLPAPSCDHRDRS